MLGKLQSIIPNPLGENAKPIPLNTLTNEQVRNIANERALRALTIATQNEPGRKGYAKNMSGLTGVRGNVRSDPNIIRAMNLIQKGPKKRTPLMFAAMKGDVERVKELLRSGPRALYLEDSSGKTALSWAAGEGHEDVVKVLLDAKSDDLPLTGYLENAIHNASGNGHVDVLRLLIDAGGDIEGRDSRTFFTPIFSAIYGNSTECLKLLLDKGANIEDHVNYGGYTPLLYAADAKPECLRILIEKGANINTHDIGGKNALFIALISKSTECIQILLDSKIQIHTTGVNSIENLLRIANDRKIRIPEYEEIADILTQARDNLDKDNKTRKTRKARKTRKLRKYKLNA